MIYILILSVISFLVLFYMALFKAAAKEDEILEEIYKDDIE
ncbi:hypothetical protein [Clostridium tarantellae]|nr:hypothetical protein [Clostridium tarantellae]